MRIFHANSLHCNLAHITYMVLIIITSPHLSLGTVQFFAVGQEIVKSRGVGGLYAGFKFKSLHLGGGGALMAYFLPFFKKLFAI